MCELRRSLLQLATHPLLQGIRYRTEDSSGNEVKQVSLHSTTYRYTHWL